MSDRKNVLMICTDHWSGSLLGCAGRKDIMTPTLDYLANNGIRYENFYSECPVCIPARRSMMTGLTPKTHGDRGVCGQNANARCSDSGGNISGKWLSDHGSRETSCVSTEKPDRV